MQVEFLLNREKALVGQKVDSTPTTIVSMASNGEIPFGALVVFDETDSFLSKLPTAKAQLEKPVGITLRQLHCESYKPKQSIPAMRQGRVWIVSSEKVDAPGDPVYVKFAEDGSAAFTGVKTGNAPLKGAVFLDRCEPNSKVPIEVNFCGGVA
jgi:hypothetical protein